MICNHYGNVLSNLAPSIQRSQDTHHTYTYVYWALLTWNTSGTFSPLRRSAVASVTLSVWWSLFSTILWDDSGQMAVPEAWWFSLSHCCKVLLIVDRSLSSLTGSGTCPFNCWKHLNTYIIHTFHSNNMVHLCIKKQHAFNFTFTWNLPFSVSHSITVWLDTFILVQVSLDTSSWKFLGLFQYKNLYSFVG